MRQNLFALIWLGISLLSSSLGHADCCDSSNSVNGKIDLAPAYAHVDVLLSGHTVHKMDTGGIKGDVYYRLWKGLVLKPAFLSTFGKKKDMILVGGIGLGFCFPYKQCLCFTPVGGVNCGYLRTTVTFFNPFTGFEIDIVEKFRSVSPYVGFEFSYNFYPNWRIILNYQYSWSRTRTKFSHHLGTSKEKSKGSSYAALLEYDLTQCWSINVGGMYNCSLSKERHGLRAYGFKLGLGYWY